MQSYSAAVHENSLLRKAAHSIIVDRLPPMTQQVNIKALAWIESYARCELSLDELCAKVRRAVGKRFIHNPHYKVVNLNQICPNRAVRITPEHIAILLAKRRQGEITEREMVDWAHMTTINDAYYWEPEDAAVVAKWVNFLIFDLKPENLAG